MMNGFTKALVQGNFFQHCLKKFDKLIGMFARKIIYRKGEVRNNRIFFMTYDNKYSCNLRYIADEILRQELPVEIFWATKCKDKKLVSTFPKGIKLVERGKIPMFEAQATSKIWFDNALNCVWFDIPKKKDQIYINTWHGSMGIKRLSGNRYWMWRAKKCRKITDYCISNSIFEENVYRDTFWRDSTYLRFGHARNDVLLQTEKHPEIIARIREKYELLEDTHILLYAPTFRDDGTTDCFDIDFAVLKASLEKQYGGNWCIFVRMHHKNKSVKLSDEWNEWLKDASSYPDMQELLVAADVGITDYSSWAYDFVITRKPLFIYATDIEKYDGTRGFYYSLTTTPFPICRNNAELEKEILDFNERQYLNRCEDFLQEKGCAESGDAAEKIVEFIKKEYLDISDNMPMARLSNGGE